jgi:hypothetical protein
MRYYFVVGETGLSWYEGEPRRPINASIVEEVRW